MGTIEIKQELHKLVEKGDDRFLKMFYEMAKTYMEHTRMDTMLLKGEEDIQAGRTYSLKEAKQILDNWEE
jgi:hypothetical protein